MVTSGMHAFGGKWLYGLPMTRNMPGLKLALQWHLWAPHVHGTSHAGIVFSWGNSLYVHAFISV